MSSFAQLVASMRKESRIAAVLPIKISPENDPAQARPACTCDISSNGARLMKLGGLAAGDVIWIARNKKKAKFKVVWVGEPGGEQDGRIGVESLERDKFIWDDELRHRLM